MTLDIGQRCLNAVAGKCRRDRTEWFLPRHTKKSGVFPPRQYRHIDLALPAQSPGTSRCESLSKGEWKIEQLSVFDRFHLMQQSDRDVDVFAR